MSAAADEAASLDPTDWTAFRADAQKALDAMIDDLATLRERPVWRATPPDVKRRFAAALPDDPRDLADVVAQVMDDIVPFANGNRHHLFMGWVHGAGTAHGMVADMLAAGIAANCGGRDHVAHHVERQIALWMADLFGFPEGASGLFVTGSSMANFCALRVALTARFGEAVRTGGLRALKQAPVAYASAEAHGCIAQAMELAGLGSHHLRLIGVDAERRMRLDELAAQVAADRTRGFAPFLVVGTAGTVNTGAIDDLAGLAHIAAAERLWFHVDGAFGALACLSPALKPKLAGLEAADSVAFDFHKWAHVPYDAGFLLVRDPAAHKSAFVAPAAYLSRAPRGLAAGEDWPCDYGPDLSRGFRALKTWFTFQVHGARRMGAMVETCCRLAAELAARVEASPRFELRAPAPLNIVCIGVTGSDGTLEREIVMDLHESGLAAPSITSLDGKPAIRCAILNHRTTSADMTEFMRLLEASVTRLDSRERPRTRGAVETSA